MIFSINSLLAPIQQATSWDSRIPGACGANPTVDVPHGTGCLWQALCPNLHTSCHIIFWGWCKCGLLLEPFPVWYFLNRAHVFLVVCGFDLCLALISFHVPFKIQNMVFAFGINACSSLSKREECAALKMMIIKFCSFLTLQNKVTDISPSNKRPVGGLNLGPTPAEPVIVHAGVLTALLRLLPSIQHPSHPRLACMLQLYTAHLIKVSWGRRIFISYDDDEDGNYYLPFFHVHIYVYI